MAESQDKDPTNQELIAALKEAMSGPIEKYESHKGKDHGLTMKNALRSFVSEEQYAKMLWRLRYRHRQERRDV